MTKFIDIHSHIAWGIDDGMPSIEDAQSTLELARIDGIVGICSTPHIIPGQLDRSIYDEIVSRQLELKEMSSIPIYFGGEVMMNSEFIDGLDLGLYPSLNGSRYMLVEYNVLRDIHSIDYRDDCLYELKVRGFIPVIAHIERYFHSGLDYSIIDNWIDMGCVLQINRTSILGMHGKQIQSNALSLLDNGYCDVIATDTHRASGNRISKLSDVYSVVSKRIGKENASVLMYENPKRILSDMDILNIEVVKKKKHFSFFRR
ncbi:CpsB/CapC family capsule biosynthesis tyrosine phosphatase [Holdemanella sp.]|uniref:tyrosine-protein phosphatase n=1 Tax=Holdemanella sp. TaxID=1971762 RepID=UPI00307BFF27